VKLDTDEIEALLVEEIKGIKGAEKALDIEKNLLKPDDKILLGSCFCHSCGRFKSYRKECPFCGSLEMTL
jgi:hypothetical protein